MIDLDILSKRIELLKQGKSLLFIHPYYGTHVIKMNPQQNRIFVDETICSTKYWDELEQISKENQTLVSEMYINALLLWNCGNWYLMEEKLKEEYKTKLDEIKDKFKLTKV